MLSTYYTERWKLQPKVQHCEVIFLRCLIKIQLDELAMKLLVLLGRGLRNLANFKCGKISELVKLEF